MPRITISGLMPAIVLLCLALIHEMVQLHPAMQLERRRGIVSEHSFVQTIEPQDITFDFVDLVPYELTPGQLYLCQIAFYRNQIKD